MNIHRGISCLVKIQSERKKQMACGCYKEIRSLIRKINESNVPKL
jgi:hypothetical protein